MCEELTDHWGMNVSFVDQRCAKWSWPCEAALGLNSENLTPGSPRDNCIISSQLIQLNQVFHLHHVHTALLVQVMGHLWVAHLRWSYAVEVLPSLCSGNVGKSSNHSTCDSWGWCSQTWAFYSLKAASSSKIEKQVFLEKMASVCFLFFWWMVRALRPVLGLLCAGTRQFQTALLCISVALLSKFLLGAAPFLLSL